MFSGYSNEKITIQIKKNDNEIYKLNGTETCLFASKNLRCVIRHRNRNLFCSKKCCFLDY